ncbi:uncharacterized protein LOC117547253 [Gymnodraco acuticeps]|uniref:Uncharacterized protein LOC117547253 n=1 Tax=Gymnodraco acuticeps TaxID=8218 RepID=A0A6P8V9N8_GYMAC|nr:uncharacterized protein LOC117547253 [Gymnodraco acuticeps]
MASPGLPSGLRAQPSPLIPVHTRLRSNTIVKFADDTTVIGLITDGDETAKQQREGHTPITPITISGESLLLCSATGLLMVDQRRDAEEDQERNKAILEMLHINKVSASHQAMPHPYMREIYQRLDSLEVQDFASSDGTLVQSFRSVVGPHYARPGWIWFNVSSLDPSMLGAELVLFRKTLHPRPISVTVTLHSVTAWQGALKESPALEDRLLSLDQRASSGYDVFDVSAVLPVKPLGGVGFQLHYTDERGSLVLHEALTQSLYCLNRGSLREPLLVLYQSPPLHI